MTYSVFKMAIKEHEKKDSRPWPSGRIGKHFIIFISMDGALCLLSLLQVLFLLLDMDNVMKL